MTEAEAHDEAREHYKAGLAAFGVNDHERAIVCYEQAIALRQDWDECLQALGIAQMRAGRLDDALATALRVTEMAPEDPLAFTSLSMIYQRRDQIDEAEAAQAKARLLSWKQELKENPNAPPPTDIDGPPGAGEMRVTQ